MKPGEDGTVRSDTVLLECDSLYACLQYDISLTAI